MTSVENTGGVPSEGTPPVSLASATRYRGKKMVFDSLHISFEPGVTGLLGPNGAGKTTLLEVVATAAPPTRGELTILGNTIRNETDARAARRHIGYLPQRFGFVPSMSPKEAVEYACWLRGASGKLLTESVAETLSLLDLEDCASHKIRTLSGGTQQRVGIAAAIVGCPAVVILDEPTVGLDPTQRIILRRTLSSMTNTTVVISTHIVDDIAAMADRVVVMAHGNLRYDGTPSGLAALGEAGEAAEDTITSPTERGYLQVMEDRT